MATTDVFVETEEVRFLISVGYNIGSYEVAYGGHFDTDLYRAVPTVEDIRFIRVIDQAMLLHDVERQGTQDYMEDYTDCVWLQLSRDLSGLKSPVDMARLASIAKSVFEADIDSVRKQIEAELPEMAA